MQHHLPYCRQYRLGWSVRRTVSSKGITVETGISIKRATGYSLPVATILPAAGVWSNQIVVVLMTPYPNIAWYHRFFVLGLDNADQYGQNR